MALAAITVAARRPAARSVAVFHHLKTLAALANPVVLLGVSTTCLRRGPPVPRFRDVLVAMLLADVLGSAGVIVAPVMVLAIP